MYYERYLELVFKMQKTLFEYINFVPQGALVFYAVLLVRGEMENTVRIIFIQ